MSPPAARLTHKHGVYCRGEWFARGRSIGPDLDEMTLVPEHQHRLDPRLEYASPHGQRYNVEMAHRCNVIIARRCLRWPWMLVTSEFTARRC